MIRRVYCSTSSTCSEAAVAVTPRRSHARRLAVILLAAVSAAGCVHVPAPTHARPALTLPDEVAQRYRLTGAVVEASLVPIGAEDGVRFYRGRLTCGDEVAEFHYLEPEGTGPLPFVLSLPILAGGKNLMWMISFSLAKRGFAVAWTRRVAAALQPGQRGHEIEQLLRRTVVHNRMLLAWARRQADIDQGRMGCLGVSMGGIIGAIVLAIEPDLRGGALCLAGGDLANLLVVSAENRAERWRTWRRVTDGTAGADLQRELRRSLVSDPARLGPYIPTDKVLLIGGMFDEVVPARHQDLLWESLGRPERRLLPLGHYTSALGFSSILGSVEEFLDRRLCRETVAVGGE